MGLITQLGLGVAAFLVLNLILLTVIKGMVKTSSVLHTVAHLIVGVTAAIILDRRAHVEFPIILLLAAAIWFSLGQSDRLMDAPDFRERHGFTVSKAGLLVSRAVLVASLVVKW